jgi:hypothetical protein
MMHYSYNEIGRYGHDGYYMRSRKTGRWLRGAKFWRWTRFRRFAACHDTPSTFWFLQCDGRYAADDPEIIHFSHELVIERWELPKATDYDESKPPECVAVGY